MKSIVFSIAAIFAAVAAVQQVAGLPAVDDDFLSLVNEIANNLGSVAPSPLAVSAAPTSASYASTSSALPAEVRSEPTVSPTTAPTAQPLRYGESSTVLPLKATTQLQPTVQPTVQPTTTPANSYGPQSSVLPMVASSTEEMPLRPTMQPRKPRRTPRYPAVNAPVQPQMTYGTSAQPTKQDALQPVLDATVTESEKPTAFGTPTTPSEAVVSPMAVVEPHLDADVKAAQAYGPGSAFSKTAGSDVDAAVAATGPTGDALDAMEANSVDTTERVLTQKRSAAPRKGASVALGAGLLGLFALAAL